MTVSNILLLMSLLFSVACTSNQTGGLPPAYSNKVLSAPEIFAEGIISTKESSEFDIFFAPNGRTAYFTRRTGVEKQKIWQSEFENGSWSDPERLSFSTDRDELPFVSPDGNTIYFGSARSIEGRPTMGNFDMNIWKVEREKDKWGKPVPLDESINAVQAEKEEWPSSNENFIFSADNKHFFFTTMLRGDSVIEVYKTTKTGHEFSKPEKINGLLPNARSWKNSPILSPDGNYLLFNSYGAERGMGGEDIYVSKRTSNGWSEAKNIGSLVNTKAEEANPRFSPDGKYFFFGREVKDREDQDGIWSIYFLETQYLQLEKMF